jgi:hypothetical protein
MKDPAGWAGDEAGEDEDQEKEHNQWEKGIFKELPVLFQVDRGGERDWIQLFCFLYDAGFQQVGFVVTRFQDPVKLKGVQQLITDTGKMPSDDLCCLFIGDGPADLLHFKERESNVTDEYRQVGCQVEVKKEGTCNCVEMTQVFQRYDGKEGNEGDRGKQDQSPDQLVPVIFAYEPVKFTDQVMVTNVYLPGRHVQKNGLSVSFILYAKVRNRGHYLFETLRKKRYFCIP